MHKLTHDEILSRRLTTRAALDTRRHPVTGVLENIRSLYNVGACFRTADAMLLQALILTGYTPAPPRKEISKTALGAEESVPWEHFADPVEAITALKAGGTAVYALEITRESHRLDTANSLPFPIALVVGNEITGVSPAVLELCDGALEIPMYGVKHSLNVAVAFGIGVWELVRNVRSSPGILPGPGIGR